MEDIFVKNLMSTEVNRATTDTNLVDLVKQMANNNHSYVVITEADISTGAITERDVVRLVSKNLAGIDYSSLQIDDVMSAPPVTITDDATFFEALVVLRSHKIRHLPVVNVSGELIGIITQNDLVDAHFRLLDKNRESTENSVSQRILKITEIDKKLVALSSTDPLLEIGNRRAGNRSKTYYLHIKPLPTLLFCDSIRHRLLQTLQRCIWASGR